MRNLTNNQLEGQLSLFVISSVGTAQGKLNCGGLKRKLIHLIDAIFTIIILVDLPFGLGHKCMLA